jgi:phosphatidylglycerophosphatase A
MEAKLKIKDIEEKQERSWRDYLAFALATCGVGYMPIAPGTWGSAVGVGVYLLALKANEQYIVWTQTYRMNSLLIESLRASFILVFLFALFLIGIWAANRVVKLTGRKDPGIVVIDEVVGQLITFLFLPSKLGWGAIAVGFFAFRLFDIWKPYPTHKFESLESGLGVMADDAVAGFYAAALLALLSSIYLSIF